MEKITFEKIKKMLENDEQYVFSKNIAIQIDTIKCLLISKNVFNQEEFNNTYESVTKIYDEEMDKKIKKTLEKLNDPQTLEDVFRGLL